MATVLLLTILPIAIAMTWLNVRFEMRAKTNGTRVPAEPRNVV